MIRREYLIKRLREVVASGHARGCQGRTYTCDCGHDLVIEGLLEVAADEIEKLFAVTLQESAPPVLAPHNSGERLPSSDAASGGADTPAITLQERKTP
jgi:hypothetical protein